jgi:hypothetical protein
MIRRTLVALAFLALGWAAAQAAQTPVESDFQVSVVVANDGQITIECVRGCGLQFGRLAPDRSRAEKSFTYGPCRSSVPTACPSGPLHGWVTR